MSCVLPTAGIPGWGRSIAITVFAACWVIGCTHARGQTKSAPPPAGANAALVQLIAVGPGSADKNLECAATGFFINEDGIILTAAHVVDNARKCLAGSTSKSIMARTAGNGANVVDAAPCDVVEVDEVHDLAVLKTEPPIRSRAGEPSPAYARLASGEVAPGTPVSVSGFPAFAWQPVTLHGKVLGEESVRNLRDNPERTSVIILDLALKHGASGGPVTLSNGGVVGVVFSEALDTPDHSMAISVRHVQLLLDHLRVKWYRAD